MSEVVEIEETCWGTVTLLVTIVIAAFTYRLFGPDQVTAGSVEKPVKKVEQFEQEVKKSVDEEKEEEEKPTVEIEAEKLNTSNASSEEPSQSSASSGPEFEIINADDVPAVEEIQKMSTKPESIIEPKEMTPEPQEEEKEVKKEEIGESSIEKVAEIANPESEPIQEIPITDDNDAQTVEQILVVHDEKVEKAVELVTTEPAVASVVEHEEEVKTPEVVETESNAKSDQPTEKIANADNNQPIDAVADESNDLSLDAEDTFDTDEASDVLDKLETAILEASTDNESKDMELVEPESLVSDLDLSTSDENGIIAEQETEKIEKETQEPNTDDFKETAAEIVDSVIDSLADFKKDQAGDQLSVDDREEEKAIQKKQLEEIQKLMEEKGMGEVNPSEQAKLYLDQ